MKGMRPLSWLWGFGECSHSSFISPVVLDVGFISEVTDPHKATLFRPQIVRTAASDFDSDSEKWLLLVLSVCPGSWSSMMVIKKCRKWEEKTKSHYYLLSYHLGGPGEHRGRYSGWSKPALLGRELILKTFIWSHKHCPPHPRLAALLLKPLTNHTSFPVSRGPPLGDSLVA